MLYICTVYIQKLVEKGITKKVQELEHNDSQVTVLLESFMIMNLWG